MAKNTKKRSKSKVTKLPKILGKVRRLEVPKSPRDVLIVSLVGTAPLVVHRFPEKAMEQIRGKQQNLAKPTKGPRNPEQEYEQSQYFLEDGRSGFPTGGLAEAIVSASVDVMPKNKSALRRNIYLSNDGLDDRDQRGLLAIVGEPVMREDVVRLAGPSRSADLRYRAAFNEWSCEARIFFDPRMFSADQILQLVTIAGESIGLCEGRPEKSLSMGWGTFRVDGVQIVEVPKPAGYQAKIEEEPAKKAAKKTAKKASRRAAA